jgi:transposase
MGWRGLSLQQWAAMRVHLPESTRSPRRGRPRVADRRCLGGSLWILWTGASWSELPRAMAVSVPAGGGSRAFLAQLND